MIFYRPDQFKWPTLISVIAVVLSSVVYATYVYIQRKHLFHLEAVYNWTTRRWRLKKKSENPEDAANSASVYSPLGDLRE